MLMLLLALPLPNPNVLVNSTLFSEKHFFNFTFIMCSFQGAVSVADKLRIAALASSLASSTYYRYASGARDFAALRYSLFINLLF